MKEIAAALVKAQKEFEPALKNSINPQFRSPYANLSSCVEAVVGALNNNGIYLMQLTDEHEDGVKVSTVFIHESGEQISAGSLFMPATKQDAQGFGSALTYARRYSLMAACCIAGEDDDANLSSRPKESSYEPKPAQVKAIPKPPVIEKVQPVASPPVQTIAPPQKMEGTVGQWQLKVSAEPGTDTEDWSLAISKSVIFALEMAQSSEDVTNIFKINRVIFDKLKAIDPVSYDMLLSKFKELKEKLNG